MNIIFCPKKKKKYIKKNNIKINNRHLTVTHFAKFLGLSGLVSKIKQM